LSKALSAALRGPPAYSDIVERAARALARQTLAEMDDALRISFEDLISPPEVEAVIERARESAIDEYWPRHVAEVCTVLEAIKGYVVGAADREGIALAVETARRILAEPEGSA
jgi:hypothetical protein